MVPHSCIFAMDEGSYFCFSTVCEVNCSYQLVGNEFVFTCAVSGDSANLLSISYSLNEQTPLGKKNIAHELGINTHVTVFLISLQ